jgi:hypothetical protein
MSKRPSDAVLDGLAIRYNNGESFEQIALDWEVKSETMRVWLKGRVTPRGPGGYVGRTNRPSPARDAPTKPSVGTRGVLSTNRVSHRRRGKIV